VQRNINIVCWNTVSPSHPHEKYYIEHNFINWNT